LLLRVVVASCLVLQDKCALREVKASSSSVQSEVLVSDQCGQWLGGKTAAALTKRSDQDATVHNATSWAPAGRVAAPSNVEVQEETPPTLQRRAVRLGGRPTPTSERRDASYVQPGLKAEEKRQLGAAGLREETRPPWSPREVARLAAANSSSATSAQTAGWQPIRAGRPPQRANLNPEGRWVWLQPGPGGLPRPPGLLAPAEPRPPGWDELRAASVAAPHVLGAPRAQSRSGPAPREPLVLSPQLLGQLLQQQQPTPAAADHQQAPPLAASLQSAPPTLVGANTPPPISASSFLKEAALATQSLAAPAGELASQDGASMLSYSLATKRQAPDVSSTSLRPAELLEQQLAGPNNEQLLAALQQLNILGAPSTSVESGGLSLGATASSQPDSALVSMFENLFKGMLSASAASLQQQQQQPQQQQSQQQQQTTPTPQPKGAQWPQQQAETIAGDQATRQSVQSWQEAQPPPGGPLGPLGAHQKLAHELQPQQNHRQTHYLAVNEPQFHEQYAPRRRPTKKRAKKSPGHSLAGPVVRVQKRPRQSSGPAKFHQHNSPTDLQTAGTIHKWKYPWLYQDDEDEEEGETEINLRFFNNFSRMGPFGGLARSIAPASIFVSVVFLILSNISLAATIIVHGVAALLRNLAQNTASSPSTSSLGHNGPKFSLGREARLLDFHPPSANATELTSHTQSNSLNNQHKSHSPTNNQTQLRELRRRKRATRLDYSIRLFSANWHKHETDCSRKKKSC